MELIDNKRRGLHTVLSQSLGDASKVDIAVAFLRMSGVRMLENGIGNLLKRGGRLRIIAGQDFGYTEPDALHLLITKGALVRVYAGPAIFHPKCYLFTKQDGTMSAVIGSSNLTSSGLDAGVEWNVLSHQPELCQNAGAAYEELWSSPQVCEATPDILARMREFSVLAQQSIREKAILEKLDHRRQEEGFAFRFTTNKSFLYDSTHKITILKEHNGFMSKHVPGNRINAEVVVGVRRIQGYIYSADAGFGLYYQIRIPDAEYSRAGVPFNFGQNIRVDVKFTQGKCEVELSQ